MPSEDLDKFIAQSGRQLFQRIQDEKPAVFNKSQWIGKLMDWSMRNAFFKTNLFRFVDVYPALKSDQSLTEHIHEYFVEVDGDIPSVMKWWVKLEGYGGFVGAKILNFLIGLNIKGMAKQFIIGENTLQAIKSVEKLRSDGFAFTVDFLGEATISEEEAVQNQSVYLELLDVMDKNQTHWQALPAHGRNFGFNQDWGYSPFSQLSIKVSSLYSQIRPVDFENSVCVILERLKEVYRKVIKVGGSLCIDMESSQYKGITLEVFRRLRSDSEFRECPHLGIALQAYLCDTPKDLDNLLQWARREGLPIEIRLVKGAYWDYEVITAKQNGWEPCVLMNKAETDAAFEALSRKILENHEICYFACGSYNIRSIAAVIEIAKELKVPEMRYEFQILYGMAEPVRNALRDLVGRVRLYCPYGEMIPGMGYLVRRLLENTSNESFLRQSFVEELDIETLLKNPERDLE